MHVGVDQTDDPIWQTEQEEWNCGEICGKHRNFLCTLSMDNNAEK